MCVYACVRACVHARVHACVCVLGGGDTVIVNQVWEVEVPLVSRIHCTLSLEGRRCPDPRAGCTPAHHSTCKVNT